ncbi:sensor histidine kinase [Boudabousia marimammalium]|uniref:histidine kinase n=1 Tax=Boudabousia marimammalium TaxID=156892 RepID=A0A1Q5PRW4_9ACTO|nr:HAMP domain-containing sensor histidine kinase [Boudabousia marimammalium]OKL50239.1 hypothetical protein BM477_02270 [Boudabousia marimammalium]
MHKLSIRATVTAVMVAVLLIALPGAILGSFMLWENDKAAFDTRVATIAKSIANSRGGLELQDDIVLQTWLSDSHPPLDSISLERRNGKDVHVGQSPDSLKMVSIARIDPFTNLVVERSAMDTVGKIIQLLFAVSITVAVALVIGYLIARKAAREISAPLVFLAAQAEQISSGQLRGAPNKSGIEEIDLVQAELQRSSERMAERIASERQFSRDVSHQIRTPLTALLLRLEELEYLSDDPEIIEGAKASISQVERLKDIIDVLLSQAQSRRGGTAQSLSILEIFSPLQEEWEEVFKRAGRELLFQDDSTGNVMATPAALSQVLATLLENSLKYGEGTTRVSARGGITGGFTVEVADEGEGMSDEIAEMVFEKGFSGQGSTGLGLGIAKDLIHSDGGSLELTRRRPPVFTISLQAATFTKEAPRDAVIAVGRRRSRMS